MRLSKAKIGMIVIEMFNETNLGRVGHIVDLQDIPVLDPWTSSTTTEVGIVVKFSTGDTETVFRDNLVPYRKIYKD